MRLDDAVGSPDGGVDPDLAPFGTKALVEAKARDAATDALGPLHVLRMFARDLRESGIPLQWQSSELRPLAVYELEYLTFGIRGIRG
jgi:hypothetical protein